MDDFSVVFRIRAVWSVDCGVVPSSMEKPTTHKELASIEVLVQDPNLSPEVKQEFDDPDMNENNRRLKLLIGILRPFVKFLSEWHIINRQQMESPLERIDTVLQNVIRAFESPTDVQAVVSNLNHLKSLKEEIDNILPLHSTSRLSYLDTEKAEVVVSFINSLLQNLKDIVISDPRIYLFQ